MGPKGDERKGQTEAARSRRFALWAILGVVGSVCVAAILYFCFSDNPLMAEYRELARFYSSKRAVSQYLRRFGPFAPLVFIAIQALQVVLAPIPGEATGILGGYLFGTWIGFIYSTIGLTLGSVIAFLLARWLGLPIVHRVVSDEVYHKFDFISKAGGELVTFICFLIPGFPKDYLCFLLGVSPMQFWPFFVVCTVGRLPGTWLLSLQGAKVRDAQYTEFVIYLVVAGIALVLAYLYRDRLYRWMHARHARHAEHSGPDRLQM